MVESGGHHIDWNKSDTERENTTCSPLCMWEKNFKKEN